MERRRRNSKKRRCISPKFFPSHVVLHTSSSFGVFPLAVPRGRSSREIEVRAPSQKSFFFRGKRGSVCCNFISLLSASRKSKQRLRSKGDTQVLLFDERNTGFFYFAISCIPPHIHIMKSNIGLIMFYPSCLYQ